MTIRPLYNHETLIEPRYELYIHQDEIPCEKSLDIFKKIGFKAPCDASFFKQGSLFYSNDDRTS